MFRLYWSDSKRGRIDWQTLGGEDRGTALNQPGYDVFGITVFQVLIRLFPRKLIVQLQEH